MKCRNLQNIKEFLFSLTKERDVVMEGSESANLLQWSSFSEELFGGFEVNCFISLRWAADIKILICIVLVGKIHLLAKIKEYREVEM